MDDNYCEDCNVGGGFDEFVPATGHTELIEANDGWVSVDEQLPEHEGEYLVCHWGMFNGQKTQRYVDRDFFYSETKEWDKTYVTHWQPLPAPPTA